MDARVTLDGTYIGKTQINYPFKIIMGLGKGYMALFPYPVEVVGSRSKTRPSITWTGPIVIHKDNVSVSVIFNAFRFAGRIAIEQPYIRFIRI